MKNKHAWFDDPELFKKICRACNWKWRNPSKIDTNVIQEGTKNDSRKLRLDLIPPKSLEDLAEVYTKGAKKYGDRNWEKGIKWSRIYAAMLRHLLNWYKGEDTDKEDGQKILASVAWGAFTLLEYARTHPELDDRPRRKNNDKI